MKKKKKSRVCLCADDNCAVINIMSPVPQSFCSFIISFFINSWKQVLGVQVTFHIVLASNTFKLK